MLELVERIFFGAVIILFLIAEPNGLTAILDRITDGSKACCGAVDPSPPMQLEQL